jgi:hypothetical protein
MGKLFGYVFILAGTVLAGTAVIAALTIGRDSASDIAIAATAGAALALPAAWVVSKRLEGLR